jgi:hypothetical protein
MSSRTPALLILALALVFVGAVLFRAGAFGGRSHAVAPPAVAALAVADTLPATPAGTGWIGTPPELHAPFTAIVVWSLADPRSLAAADRAEKWRLLYGSLGARIIGIHAPHAAFDADSEVVATEVARRGLGYPVALDGSLAWTHELSSAGPRPCVVIADSLGRVCYTGVDDAAAERELEHLVVIAHPEMASPGSAGDSAGSGAPTGGGAADAVPAAATGVRAPVWLGAGDHPTGPLADVTPGGPRTFHAELSTEIAGTPWVPTPIGLWSLGSDGLTAARGGAQQWVALRYDAVPLAVVASAARGGSGKLWVLRDDAWLPRAVAGADVRFDARGGSYVEVAWPRLYDVVRADGHPHVVKLSPEEPGLTLHAFVFEPVPPVAPARP